MTYPIDHAGLEVQPFDTCLELLASVPVGRIGFFADGELVILPVNHLVDGQHVVFRTAAGSKLSAAENGGPVVFEADSYDDLDRSGWSVVVNGLAEVIDDAETGRLSGLGLHPWSTAVEHPFWIRIRPTSVSGRRTPGA
jgi:nitroimidazol reductase NimA-like FMN-containing flavoprotein (pyridoxamine 5'-phosphate oxidase superfamily)